jgi:hypothetical protein
VKCIPVHSHINPDNFPVWVTTAHKVLHCGTVNQVLYPEDIVQSGIQNS